MQYTAAAFTGRLESTGVAISMNGRGRWLDNVFVERLWRTVKYEHVYLHDHATGVGVGLGRFYNDERLHAALDYLMPAAVYATAWGESNGVIEVVQINVKFLGSS